MEIRPCNRHLLVEILEQQEDDTQSSVLLPDSFTPIKENEFVKIIAVAHDCDKFDLEDAIDHVAIVPGNMLKSFTYHDHTHYLVQENYVLAVVGETIYETDKKAS